MQNKTVCRLLSAAFLVTSGIGGAQAAMAAVTKEGGVVQSQTPSPQNPPRPGQNTPSQEPGGRRPGPPGGPGGFRPTVGEVVAVRGNVLQMRAEGSSGLTRVILADGAMIMRDETFSTDVLKPGMKVAGSGRPVEGTGVGAVPLRVEVQTLRLGGGMGGPFMFGGGGPLMRGRPGEVFRRQTYVGEIAFDAVVQSVNPLVLADEQGKPLPIVLGDHIEVHRQGMRRIKEGDITAGARLMAFGETAPDGLLNGRMIMLFREGSDRGSVSGTIQKVSEHTVTVRPAFAPQDLAVEIDPAAKFYFQEPLDLDSVQVGDTLAFTGRVIGGTATAPKALIVRTITGAEEDAPKIEGGGGGFGPFAVRAVMATVKGKILSLEPLRVQMAEGREVAITVPGQVVYVRYRPLERAALKADQKALLMGKSTERGFVADVVIVNPSLALWFPAR